MPFVIVRNDIVNMQVDAVVNTANPQPVIGYGCDYGIHQKAGPQLLEARKQLGEIPVGDAKMTDGYGLYARYVIHAVGPVWLGGGHGEEALLRRCYDRALMLALDNGCESVAFPLISAGNHGFPKPLALQTALAAFSSFLSEHEMQVYLVVFSESAFRLSEKLFQSVESYIDETYIHSKFLHEYGVEDKCMVRQAEQQMIVRRQLRQKQLFDRAVRREDAELCMPFTAPQTAGMDAMLRNLDAGFSETLLKLIDRTGKKDSEIYKKANIDRKLFSKIRNNPTYQPSKITAVAFAVALELNLEETRDFIGRAGYALTHSSKFDVIVEYFIKQRIYDIFQINAVLFEIDQPLIGG